MKLQQKKMDQAPKLPENSRSISFFRNWFILSFALERLRIRLLLLNGFFFFNPIIRFERDLFPLAPFYRDEALKWYKLFSHP